MFAILSHIYLSFGLSKIFFLLYSDFCKSTIKSAEWSFSILLWRKSIFPDNKQLNLTADYVLYGVENVKKSIELNQVSIDTFEAAPNYSIKAIKEAIELVPDNMTYYETLIEILFRQNKYSDVIDVYNKLNEKNMTRLKGTIIEFISISFLNLNDLGKGCYLAKILNDINYQLSPDVLGICYNVLNPN